MLSHDFYEQMERRRSVRMFSSDPVPKSLIETAVKTASTAPSGAHKQPWTFVATQNPEIKHAIRVAAEKEEEINYLENRMNKEWQEALAPLGTDHHKEFLEIAPWIVVLFEQRYETNVDESTSKNYYVKESCGIAAGFFIAALHHMGLATLTHTPTPMNFLNEILDRPKNERPFVLFPVGYPLKGVKVPNLSGLCAGERDDPGTASPPYAGCAETTASDGAGRDRGRCRADQFRCRRYSRVHPGGGIGLVFVLRGSHQPTSTRCRRRCGWRRIVASAYATVVEWR